MSGARNLILAAGTEVDKKRGSRRKRRKPPPEQVTLPMGSMQAAVAHESKWGTGDSKTLMCNPVPVNGEADDAQTRTLSKKRPRSSLEEGVESHPFPTEYGDHFETPLEAYRDVAGALELLSKKLGKKKKKLQIWDPYYCAGRTPRLLRQLGFHRVEHRNEDFYKIVQDNKQPVYDVLVTNPPYSGEHKRRCLEYCKGSGKPWFLLIPNYVATKDYFKRSVLGAASDGSGEPFYVVPKAKYLFDHPEGTGHAESPFFAVWFVHCGAHNDDVFNAFKAQERQDVRVLRSLQDLAKQGTVKTVRRLNPRQRRAVKKKRDAAADKLA